MKRHILGLMLGLGGYLAAANSVDAGHKVRYYYAPPVYYTAPVYYARPVYVAPAPVVVHRPAYYSSYYYPAPAYGWHRPAVYAYPAPAYCPPYREVEVKYRWTRRGLRVKYDYDD